MLTFMASDFNFWDIFWSIENPIFFTFLFAIIFIALIFLIKRKIISPMKVSHKTEIDILELKHTQNLALFAELDPEPIIRFNEIGEILSYNIPADNLLGLETNTDLSFQNLFSEIRKSPKCIIDNSQNIHLIKKYGPEYFSLNIVGTEAKNIIHVYYHNITDRILAEEDLKKAKKQIRELAVRNEKVRDEEARRIASELHDSVGQELLFTKLNIKELNRLNDSNKEQVYNELTDRIDSVVDQLRDICYRLKPKVLETNGLPDAVSILIERYNKTSTIIGQVSDKTCSARLDSNIELVLYRIIQEALNNILKHSEANIYEIEFILIDEIYKLIILDDGIGFDLEEKLAQEKPNLGLVNIFERVEIIGGSIKIITEEDEGTILIIEISKNNLIN